MVRTGKLITAAAVAALLLVTAGFANGGRHTEAATDAEVNAIKADIGKTATAWNNKNIPDFLAGFTDQGLKDVLDFPDRATATQELSGFIGEDQIALVSLTSVAVAGNSASGYMLLTIGGSYEYSYQNFIFDNGRWKFAAAQLLNAPIPQGTPVLSVGLKEYQFVYDKSQVASGNFAISASNSGKEVHEIVLVKNDAGKPIRDVLLAGDPQSDQPPPGVTFIVGQDNIKPGETRTVVFTKPLAPGNYAFVCFMPDPNGTPHFIDGMTSDFVVGSGVATGSGAALGAPRTGDAGLADSDAGLANVYTLLGVALLIGALGAGGLIASRRRV